MTYIVTGHWRSRPDKRERLGHRKQLSNEQHIEVPDLDSAERLAKELVEAHGATYATFNPKESQL